MAGRGSPFPTQLPLLLPPLSLAESSTKDYACQILILTLSPITDHWVVSRNTTIKMQIIVDHSWIFGGKYAVRFIVFKGVVTLHLGMRVSSVIL